MRDPIDEMVANWRKKDDALNPGATASDLDRFEEDFQGRLPEDFRKLYGLCDGMPDLLVDCTFLALWPLERIREDSGVWWSLEFSSLCITFADAMISAPNFTLRIPPAGPATIIATWWNFELAQQEPVANSVTEFAKKHLAGDLPGPLYFK